MLIRMTMALCAGIFGAMAVGGENNGQKRFGLIPQATTPLATTSQAITPPAASVVVPVAVVTAPVVETPMAQNQHPQVDENRTTFAPDQPVMVATTELEVALDQLLEPTKFVLVGANSANVRQGPGKEHAVVGRVTAGQEVQLLSQDGDWSLIKSEDGAIEGYVASRLLQG